MNRGVLDVVDVTDDASCRARIVAVEHVVHSELDDGRWYCSTLTERVHAGGDERRRSTHPSAFGKSYLVIKQLMHRHRQECYFSLNDLPQSTC